MVQQVAGVCGDLEAAMSRVSQNFRNMASDFNDQRWVINVLGENLKTCQEEFKASCTRMESSMDDLHRLSNSLSNWLGEETAAGVQLRQDVALLMAWSKEMEDGSMVVTSECLQRLEDWMAEKDAEIAALCEKVCLSSCRDRLRLMINDRFIDHFILLVGFTDQCFRCATVVQLRWRSRRRRRS